MKVQQGFWNCCIARPQYILAFDGDNGETVYHYGCVSCASTFPKDRVQPARVRKQITAFGTIFTVTLRYDKKTGKTVLRLRTMRKTDDGKKVIGDTVLTDDSNVDAWEQYNKVVETVQRWKVRGIE